MKILIRLFLLISLFHPAFSFQLHINGRPAHHLCLAQSRGSASNNDADPVLQLPLLEAELGTCQEKKCQSELKEEISNAKTAAEFGVRRAQLEFYDAFSNQDLDAMKKVWSDSDDVRCVHPGMESLSGVDAIMKSWSQVFQAEAFSIQPERVKIEICGATAVCSCVEGTPNGGKLEALNIYRREGGNWHMTLHMASPIVMRVSK